MTQRCIFSRRKARGFAVPRRSEAIGNIISLSICPGFDISGDGARVLQSVEIGLRLAKFLGLRCLISGSPIPPLISEQWLYIDTLPVALQSFFGDRVLDWHGAADAVALRGATTCRPRGTDRF